MVRRNAMVLAAVVLTAGLASFAVGRLVTAPASDRSSWLGEAPRSVQEADRRFQDDVQRLAESVTQQKDALAALLTDANSGREQIFDQVDRLIDSHAILMRAVGAHLVQVRDSLPGEQRQALMQSCGRTLQRQMQRRYRWRGGAGSETSEADRGNGFGGGRGSGQGGGQRGMMRRYRGGSGGQGTLARRLQLTDAQIATAQTRDPDFDADCTRLRDQVLAAHETLLASFENEQLSDDELLAAIDTLVIAHDALEMRVAEYVVVIFGDLSDGQRQALASCI